MASVFNKRVFGSDLDPNIKNKLRARQVFAEKSKPNESLEFQDIDGHQINLFDAIGGVNFPIGDKEGSLVDLSSRTPWVRMWTSVELFIHTEAIYGPEHGKTGYVGTGEAGGAYTAQYEKKKKIKIKDVKREESVNSLESKVYVIGNHILNTFSSGDNLFDPIFPGKSTAQESIGVKAGDIFKDELQSNDFMKPQAGITSVNSQTEGIIGAIKRTTINFTVHNFQDFQNIYSKYFLKPGALIFIDFGWDTSFVYNPHEIIKNNRGEDIIKILYGDSESNDNGIVGKSKGDLEVIIGRVVKWNAKVKTDGGWECNLEIVSENEGLLDHEISNSNNLRNKFVSGIGPYVVNQAAHLIGADFLRNDWSTSKDNLIESEQYANSFAKELFSSGDPNPLNIPDSSLQVGLYWQALSNADSGVVGSNGNIYISWGFFEDEILNKELSLGFGEKYEFGGKFDSSNSWITYDKNLLDRQNLVGTLSLNKDELKFLYPPRWNDTYNVIHNKIPIGSDPNIDKNEYRIPFREIFINISVIKNGFKSNNSINDAIKSILDEISEYSFNVFDLQLSSLTIDNSILSIIDRNFTNKSYDKDFFDNLFVFKPHSPSSIVKSFELSLDTPKNGLQNMIAIQNTSTNFPIFPMTPNEEVNNALRSIASILSMDQKHLGIRHIPELRSNKVEKNDISKRYKEDPGHDDSKALLTIPEASEALVNQYKSLFKVVQDSRKVGENSTMYKGLSDDEYDVDKDTEEKSDIDEDYEENILIPGALYAKNLEEYYGYRAKKDFMHESLSTILPFQLNLSLYGIANIFPGDLFKIDYLPKQYREIVYFQVIQVSHDINSSSWTTKLETVMRIHYNSKNQSLYIKPNRILLSSNWFSNIGLPSDLKKYFKEFEITHYGGPGIIVLTSKGRKKGDFLLTKSGFWHAYSREEEQYNYSYTSKFIVGVDDAGLLYGYSGNMALDPRETFLSIKEDEDYFIVLALKGAIPYLKKDLSNNNTNIGSLIKKIREIAQEAQDSLLFST